MPVKDYLGDSVYAAYDPENGGTIVLTTENGRNPSNTIYLEPQVIEALQRFLKRVEDATA